MWVGMRAGGDPERPMQPLPQRREAEAALERAMLSLADAPCKTAEQLRDMLSDLGLQVRQPSACSPRWPCVPAGHLRGLLLGIVPHVALFWLLTAEY